MTRLVNLLTATDAMGYHKISIEKISILVHSSFTKISYDILRYLIILQIN